MKQANLDLHIEELVLHGFRPGDQYDIAFAVERELTRLLSEQGMPPPLAQGLTIGNLDAGAFNVSPNTTADNVGEQVAQALYGGLNR